MQKLNNGLTKITVGEVVELCFNKLDAIDERKNNLKLMGIKDTNASNDKTRVEFILARLENVPEDVKFSVEGCRGDMVGEFFPNAGSLIECIVKYFLAGGKCKDISKSDMYDYDAQLGWAKFEIKSSVSPKHLATPSNVETTILVNKDGVYEIKKADVLGYVNKQGRLPYNGKHINAYKPEWLNKALGYEC